MSDAKKIAQSYKYSTCTNSSPTYISYVLEIFWDYNRVLFFTVSIQGQGGLFRGFILQARTPSGGSRSWGQFFPLQTGDFKVIQCQNGLTLTHTASNDKNIVRFAWIPEPGMRDQVQFV